MGAYAQDPLNGSYKKIGRQKDCSRELAGPPNFCVQRLEIIIHITLREEISCDRSNL